jgi:uncharacterized glyoxalase superfamily protein PhnB
MQVNPYLSFKGQCEAAFRFYEQCLGGQLGPILSTAEAERIFRELSTEGRVVMPLEKTFWAERFGMVVDRFGVPWLINCEGSDQPA